MTRTAVPAVALVLALLAAAPAHSIELPPEPAPVLFSQQYTGIHFTSPAVVNDVANVTSHEVVFSGTVGAPFARSITVTLYRVLSSGMRGPPAVFYTRCIRSCGSLAAQFSFGPRVAIENISLSESRDYLLHVDTFRYDGAPLGSFDRSLVVKRIPPPDTLNVFATGMNVTQGIQPDVATVDRRRATDLPPRPAFPSASGATYVEGKQTVVRVLAAADGTSASSLSGVEARLEGTRNGQDLPGSPLSPVHTGAVPDATGEADLADVRQDALNTDGFSINFRLPLGWRKGTVRLRAILNPAGTAGHFEECPGCEDRANQVRAQVKFTETPRLRLEAWHVFFTAPPVTVPFETRPTPEFFAPVIDTFPLRASHLLVNGYQGGVATQSVKCEQEISDVESAAFLAFAPGLLVGVLPSDPLICTAFATDDDPANDRFALGASNGNTAVTRYGDGLTPPHELAHNLDIRHSSCAHDEVDGGGCSDTYPVTGGALDGPGYDLRALRAVVVGDPTDDSPGAHTHDLMSYGNPTWISRFTFEALLSAIRARAGADGVASAAKRGGVPPRPEPRLLVTGSVSDAGAVRFTRLLAAEGRARTGAQPSGPYELRALDASGNVLRREPFAPRFATHSRGVGVFTFTLPDPGRIAALTVVRDGKELARRSRSAATPSLSLDDRRLDRLGATGTRTIAWSAADADGDPLSFALQFSADGGRTWRAVGFTSGDARSFQLDLSYLSATRTGRLRLLASDGFNTRVVASGRNLTVPNHPPDPVILGPVAETSLMAGDSLDVIGAATDADQPPGTAALRWSSDRDGAFGAGAEATLIRPSVGRHVVSLRATTPAAPRGSPGWRSAS